MLGTNPGRSADLGSVWTNTTALVVSCVVLCFILLAASATWATGQNFIPIDVPGERVSYASGINDRGQVVGSFCCPARTSGFLYDNGRVSTVEDPNGSRGTEAHDINNRGQIVGAFDDATMRHGFLQDKGVFTTIDVPGAIAGTNALGINNHGDIVGAFFDRYESDHPGHGFLYDNGKYSTFDAPGGGTTVAYGINDRGQIVGIGGAGAFIRDTNGQFSLIDVPGAAHHGTFALGINNRGDIGGQFLSEVDYRFHGFLYENGQFTIIDVPGGIDTDVRGINNAGLFVGSYVDVSHLPHAYIDPPSEMPEPGSFVLLTSGVTILGIAAYRRTAIPQSSRR